MSQKDLFEFAPRMTSLPQAPAPASAKSAFSFLEQTRVAFRLDQLLTVSIALMVGMAVIYTSGIEKGRRMSWTVPAAVPASVEIAQTPVEPVPASADIRIEPAFSMSSSSRSFQKTETLVATSTQRISSGKPDGSYTIQLVTYKEESLAQKKVQALASQGLEGFLIPSGSYYQVCVNGFAKRQEASQNLIRLKSKGIAPRDAYVRMIPA